MTIDKAIKLIVQIHEKARKMPHIKKPLAYALYQTWKIADREERESGN